VQNFAHVCNAAPEVIAATLWRCPLQAGYSERRSDGPSHSDLWEAWFPLGREPRIQQGHNSRLKFCQAIWVSICSSLTRQEGRKEAECNLP
jgi:hypothetical protein